MKNHFIKTFIAQIRNNLITYLTGIIGISIGLACILIVLLYSMNELSFNKIHLNHEKIFRVILKDNKQNKMIAGTPALLYNLFAINLEKTVSTAQTGFINDSKLIDKEGNIITVKDVMSVSPELLEMFTIKIKDGNQKNISIDPGSIFISESFAKKVFADNYPIGELVTLRIGEEDYPLTIKSVFKDFPVNSSFTPNIICHSSIKLNNLISTFDKQFVMDSWFLKSFQTYIYIPFETDISIFEDRLTHIIKESLGRNFNYSVKLQRLSDLYFESGEIAGVKHGNKQLVYAAIGIGTLILVIGIINFIILSIAQSVKRSKEYGVRRIHGAQKSKLRDQIILESVILSCIALPFAYIILNLLLPVISNYLNTDLSLFLKQNRIFYIYSVLVTIITGLITGFFISLNINRIHIKDLIGNQKMIHGKQRKISIHYQLMILELIIFIGLANISINTFRQINFSKNIELGFSKDNLLKIYIEDDEFQELNYQNYLDEIKRHPGIVSVSGAAVSPGSDEELILQAYCNSKYEESTRVNYTAVDYNFCSTMEIPILEGRSFTDENEFNFTNKVIVNKAFIDYFSIDDPIGSNIWLDWYGQKQNKEIIGVTDNFFFHSTREEIMPCVIELNPLLCYEYLVRYNPKNGKEVINFLNNKWMELSPSSVFHFEYFDHIIDRFYTKEKKLSALVNLFFFITIMLSIVGLYATSLYTLKQKQKHIGIMKVFGANKKNIFNLFTRDFLLAIIIASFISIPIVKYLLSIWLQNFKYQINNTIWHLLLGTLIAIIVVYLAIIINVIKSTRINPIEIINYE
ncbi:MAG: FtsX-like permease family protein [Bacteroidales bacterium]